MKHRLATFVSIAIVCINLLGCGTPWDGRSDRLTREGVTIVSAATDRESALSRLLEGGETSTLVYPGDVINIRRDYSTESDSVLVRPDGTFSYQLAGQISAIGKTPEDIAETLKSKLTGIVRYPKFSVNITESAGNRAFIGGEVKQPGFVSLRAGMTLQQGIAAQGGLLNTANGAEIAVLRQSSENRYELFLIDFNTAFLDSGGVPIRLRRDDMVYVTKSRIAQAVDIVDFYINRLIPFNKSINFLIYDASRSNSY